MVPGTEDSNKDKVDFYRDTYVRYVGYSNEVGEAFRPLVPASFVAASYGFAIAYVCMDVFDKARKEQRNRNSLAKTTIVAGDVFIWQMLASVIIPGFTINRITKLANIAVNKAKMNKYVVRTLPTALGLASIPIIIHPIDKLVDNVMDNTYRKWITP